MAAPAIGIDLGTTYSCVAVYRNGRAEIIPNAEGNRITPSYVAFTDTERLVGDAAKSQDALNPTNTIFDAKRLIGRKFDDPLVQDDMKVWPFKVINDNGRPKIQVKYKGQNKTLFPEEVSSIVLTKMKETAEAYLGKIVRNAVITVPAYFSDSQRQATKDAGTIAGLNVLRIINEPTAGALAYGIGEKKEEEYNVLVYDLGGGTFDVSILTIDEGVFEVRSTSGNTHLGGEDFDSNMVDYFIKEFKDTHKVDLKNNPQAIKRLRTQCEQAKRILSIATETKISIDAIAEGKDFSSKITRARFEEINDDLFRSTLEPVENALRGADMTKAEIDEVVLVGGSTRIPMIQKLLKDFFEGKQLNQSVNPDEAVAVGAAIQAANLDGVSTDMVLVDVTPLSLGTDVQGNIMSVIIKRNTIIPTTHTQRYYEKDDEEEINSTIIPIFEGERPMASDNNLLGKFTLEDIPRSCNGKAKYDITFTIDADSILHVSAVSTTVNNMKKLTINNDKGRLSKEQIDQLIKEAEEHKVQDQKRKEAAEAKNELESYCNRMKKNVRDMKKRGKISNSDEQTILNKCEETTKWAMSDSQADKNDVIQKRKQLERICDSILV